MKYHLACLDGNNVSKCGKVPTDVKEEMLALLTKKTSEKEQKQKDKQRARVKLKLIWSAQMVKCAVKTLTMSGPRMRRSCKGTMFLSLIQ